MPGGCFRFVNIANAIGNPLYEIVAKFTICIILDNDRSAAVHSVLMFLRKLND